MTTYVVSDGMVMGRMEAQSALAAARKYVRGGEWGTETAIQISVCRADAADDDDAAWEEHLVPVRGARELRDAILAASLALDPEQRGDCWPDPIAWDGRPLAEQAVDTLKLAESVLDHHRDPEVGMIAARDQLRAALDAVRPTT